MGTAVIRNMESIQFVEVSSRLCSGDLRLRAPLGRKLEARPGSGSSAWFGQKFGASSRDHRARSQNVIAEALVHNSLLSEEPLNSGEQCGSL